METYHSDFQSLLSLLYSSVTKLGLVFNPSDPTYTAALAVLMDIRTYVDALGSCACSARADFLGRTFVKEMRWVTEDVLQTLQTLMNYFGLEKKEEKGYLVHIGVVQEAIDRARRVSNSNIKAVEKVLEANLGGLDDGVKELQDLIEETDETDISDDGWNDMEVSALSKSRVKFTEEELSRLKTVRCIYLLLVLEQYRKFYRYNE